MIFKTQTKIHIYSICEGRVVATNRQVAGSIPDGVIGIFQ